MSTPVSGLLVCHWTPAHLCLIVPSAFSTVADLRRLSPFLCFLKIHFSATLMSITSLWHMQAATGRAAVGQEAHRRRDGLGAVSADRAGLPTALLVWPGSTGRPVPVSGIAFASSWNATWHTWRPRAYAPHALLRTWGRTRRPAPHPGWGWHSCRGDYYCLVMVNVAPYVWKWKHWHIPLGELYPDICHAHLFVPIP